MRVLLDATATGGQLTLLRTQLRHGDASPLHVQSQEDEMFILLRGEAVCWVGEARSELGEGGVAFLPRALPYAYRITSATANMFTLCTPAGIEGFFRSGSCSGALVGVGTEAGHGRTVLRRTASAVQRR